MVSSFKKLIKNIFKSFGFSIQKLDKSKDNYTWLSEYNIQTVLDIGANTGQFAVIIAEHLPKATIHSFEPISSVYEQLLVNTKHLNLHAYNFALGDDNVSTRIQVNEFSPSSSLLELEELHKDNFKQTTIKNEEQIELKRLDDIKFKSDIKKNVLVKLDVQGFEDQVINGGEDFIRNATIIVLEAAFSPLYKNEKTFSYHYNKMIELGFEYQGVFFEEVRSKINGKPLYADLIFIKINR